MDSASPRRIRSPLCIDIEIGPRRTPGAFDAVTIVPAATRERPRDPRLAPNRRPRAARAVGRCVLSGARYRDGGSAVAYNPHRRRPACAAHDAGHLHVARRAGGKSARTGGRQRRDRSTSLPSAHATVLARFFAPPSCRSRADDQHVRNHKSEHGSNKSSSPIDEHVPACDRAPMIDPDEVDRSWGVRPRLRPGFTAIPCRTHRPIYPFGGSRSSLKDRCAVPAHPSGNSRSKLL